MRSPDKESLRRRLMRPKASRPVRCEGSVSLRIMTRSASCAVCGAPHTAHFDRGSFYNHFFRDLQGKVAFLEETLAWVPCGQPSHTFCDVERAVLARLRKSNLLDAYRALRAAEVEGVERALLAKLREKYEGAPTASQTSAPILHRGDPPKTRRTAQQSGQTNLF